MRHQKSGRTLGRTARAGASGQAVAFCSEAETKELRAIEKVLKTRIAVAGGKPWSTAQDAGNTLILALLAEARGFDIGGHLSTRSDIVEVTAGSL